jgi:integrase
MARNRRGKGEGSIHQRRDGYWVGSVEAGYRWSEAKQKMVRRQARVVRKSRPAVVEALDELRRQVSAGVVPDRKVTVAAFLDWYVEHALPEIADSTREQYRTRVSAWITPYVGQHRLVKLTRLHVLGMMSALRDKGYSAATRSQALTLLRQAMAEAVASDMLIRNPCDGVKAPTPQAKTDDTPTAEESRALLEAAEEDRLGAMAVLVLKYGLRQGELRGLRWSDVGDDELTVRRSTTKTDSGARTLPLLPDVKAALARHRKAQAAERLAAQAWADDELVFTTERGRAIGKNAALDWWHALCAAAEVRRCRMHAGRHAAATLLFEAGVAIETVAAILGHRDVATTRKVYLRVRSDLQRKALTQIA